MSNVQPGPEPLVIVEGDLLPGVEVGDTLRAVDVEPGTIIKDTHGFLYRRAEAIHVALNYAARPHWRRVDFVTVSEHAAAVRRARVLVASWWVAAPLSVVLAWAFMLTIPNWVLPGLGSMAVMILIWHAAYRAACTAAGQIVLPDSVTFDESPRP